MRFADEPEFTELYDYEEDPDERLNLSGHPEHKEIAEKLTNLNREHVEFTQNKQFKR